MTNRKYTRYLILFVIILSSAVYFNSIFGGFVLDDMVLIQKNPAIHSFWNIGLLTYRWVRTFSYAVDYAIWGLNPIGYHLSNLLYNTLTVLVVLWMTRRLTGNYIMSFVTAFAFALHPIHTEAVSYLSGRRDILSALFYLLGFLAYLKGRETGGTRCYVGAVLCYLLGISAKEMAITLPFLIFAYEILRDIHEERDSSVPTGVLFCRSLRKNLQHFKWVILFSALLLAGYLYIILFLEHASGMVTTKGIKWWGGDPVSNFTTVFTVVAAYVKKLLFPVVLRFDYRMTPLYHSFLDVSVLLSMALILGLLLFSFLVMRRHRLVTFAVWFFFITLLPVMQIIPHHMLMAEHYLYLPSYGFCLLGGLLADRVYRLRTQVFLLFLSGFLVGSFYFVRTVDRNRDWLDTFALTAEGLRHDPENPVNHFFRGHAYHLVHLEQTAWRELEKAVYPKLYRDSKVFAIRAVILFKQGAYKQGEKETEKSLELDPHDQMALMNAGYFALMRSENKKALQYYLQVQPDYEGGGHLPNIAKIYLEEGRLDEAEEAMESALSLHPDRSEFHYDMAEVLVKELKFQQAAKEYREALRLAGDDLESYDFLKGVPEKIGWAERLQQKLDALEKGGHQAEEMEADRLYGELYLDAGNNREAERRLRSALAAGDISCETRCLLAKAFLKQGKYSEALKVTEGLTGEKGSSSDVCLETSVDVFSQGLDFEEAMRLEKELVSQNPGNKSFTDRLSALKKMRDLQEKSNRFVAEGDDPGATVAKGELFVKLGRVKEAISTYESAINKNSVDLKLLLKLYDLYEAVGYPYRAKAIRTGRSILQIDPDNFQIALRLWRFYYNKVENYENALVFLEKAVKANPNRTRDKKIEPALNALRRYVGTYLESDRKMAPSRHSTSDFTE